MYSEISPTGSALGAAPSSAAIVDARPISRAHLAEDLRSIAAVERLRSVYGPEWPQAVPSLARRLHDHVACGDCPLGLRQAGAASRLIGRRR